MKRLLVLLLTIFALPAWGDAQPCTPAQLQARLAKLKTIAAACEAQKTKSACDDAQVGEDVTVSLPNGTRAIDFDWLRKALADAAKHPKQALPLKSAEARLDLEQQEIGAQAVVPAAQLQRDQAKLQHILESGNFAEARPPNPLQELFEAFLGWLSRRFAGFSGNGSKTQWISQLLIGVVALAACGGLLLWFSRMQRKQRLLWQSPRERDIAHAAALQDWQLWRQEAQQLAAQQRWSEGIHRLYWAAIAQMESRGVWRHDATRTPREYLELLAPQSVSRRDLLQLTRSLEVFWYAGQPAREQDYASACTLLESLVRP